MIRDSRYFLNRVPESSLFLELKMETAARTMTKRVVILGSPSEKPNFRLRWGNKKPLRRVKTQQQEESNKDKIAVNTISRAEKKLTPYRSTGYNTRKSETLGTVNGEGDGFSSSGSGEVTVWPKFVVALSHWEKEEDFLNFKGGLNSLRDPRSEPNAFRKSARS